MSHPQETTKPDDVASKGSGTGAAVDTSSHPAFFDYYAAESASESTLHRLRHVRDVLIKVAADNGTTGPMIIADIYFTPP